MTYHVHPPDQIKGLIEFLEEWLENNFVPDTFAGPGTTGYVPDPIIGRHHALSDFGEWRQATKVFFQNTQPTDAESNQGDMWLVTT